MTPLQIEIALWYHYSPHDYRHDQCDRPMVLASMPPAVREAIERYERHGLLAKNPKAGGIDRQGYVEPSYVKTDKLSEYVSRLCAVTPAAFPGQRRITDQLLRDIDTAMRAAESRLRHIAEVGGESWAGERTLGLLTQALFRLEHQSEAAFVPDLIKMETE